MKIFVSYTHADRWQVKQIAAILEDGGHNLWYDHHIIVGHDWKQSQLKAIIDCDSFLWLLSPESVQSEWCLWEFAEAVKANKPIIPVLIQSNTRIPSVLQQLQYADFTEGATPANVARLMAGVHNALHIIIEDVSEIRAFPRGVPHSVQEPNANDDNLVFISYTRKDVDFADQVRERLKANGHRTWMDRHDIPAGAIWPEEIDKALNRATVVVGIMSPASVQSQNVTNEWSWALEYKVRLILLYLEECRRPHRFIQINFIDFRHDREDKFGQLLHEISKSFNTSYAGPDPREPLPVRPNNIIGKSIESILPRPFAWCRITAGTVQLEGMEGCYVPQGGKKQVGLPTFFIGKYPVTNEQYQKFIAADGYVHEQWWDTEGWLIRKAEQWVHPRYWQEPKWNQSKKPVVGVSLYEAMAYCNWLTSLTGEAISLPTEAQWQRAAQGDQELNYPWGNSWKIHMCNNSVDYTSTGTSVVTQYEGSKKLLGLFNDQGGKSPFQVADMSGNVWEWCDTSFETGKSFVADGKFSYILRGGSWEDDDIRHFCCKDRNWDLPDKRRNTWGFRIVKN